MRQARYAAQLAGTAEAEKDPTQESQKTKETKENNKEPSPESPMAPNSPPRKSDEGWGFPQNFVRISLAQLFKTDKKIRSDGKIQRHKNMTIPLHTNRFASLPEVQDAPPIPRWTPQLLQFQILCLMQRMKTKKKRMAIQSTTRILRQNVTYATGTLPTSASPLTQLNPTTVTNSNTETTIPTSSEQTLFPNNYRVFTSPSLTDAITLRPGQHVVVNGQRFILRGIPTFNTLPNTVPETQQNSNPHLCVPDEEVSSENSVDEFHHCYIRPEPNESNAESAQRDEEINERIRLRKIKRKHNKQNSLPDKPRSPPTQRQRVCETQHTTNVVTIPPHTTSLTVDEGGGLSNTRSEQMCETSMTVPALCIAESSLQPSKEGVDPSSSISPDGNLSQSHDNKVRIIQQNVQTITLDDLNPHGLYPHHDNPIPAQPITIIYDSGASITMLPGAFTDSWRNLRPSLMKLSGAFATETQLQTNLWVGEFHAELTLNDGERIRAIFPEAVSLPPEHNTYLLCDTQFLLARHTYTSDLRKP